MNPDSEKFPGPAAAVVLTAGAWLTASLVFQHTADALGPTLAGSVALLVGIGGVGALGVRYVPPARRARLGVRGVPPRLLPAALLLMPVVVLGTEASNLVRAALPPPDAAEIAVRIRERLATDTAERAVSTVLFAAALGPVVEEAFFRGLIQQGLVSHLGRLAGVLATAGLFAAAHGSGALSLPAFLSIFGSNLLYGIVFGAIRLASGSLLAPTLVHVGVNALGLLGMVGAQAVPVAGFNAPGAHVAPAALVPALAAVGLGLAWCTREIRRRPAATPPDPG